MTLRATPTPVITAQPAIAAISAGMSSGTGTTLRSWTTTRSAKLDAPSRWCTGPSVSRMRVVPSNSPPDWAWTAPISHRIGAPTMHWRHRPQLGRHNRATRSPTRIAPRVRSPTARTRPAPS